MTDGDRLEANERAGTEPYDPRSQLTAVGASMFVALLYIFGTSYAAIPGRSSYPPIFFISSFIVLGVSLFGAIDKYPPFFPGWLVGFCETYVSTIRNTILYVETFLSIGILGWATIYSGGPVSSPYSVILLAVALISPFVTDSIGYALVVSGMVAIWYLIWWGYSVHVSVEPFSGPSWLVASTSFASVGISMVLEYVRKQRELIIEDVNG